MEARGVTREFQYSAITLPDPSPTATPEAVKALYAAQFPELATAVVEDCGITAEGNHVFKFLKAVGTKGNETRPRSGPGMVRAIHLARKEIPEAIATNHGTATADALSSAGAQALASLCCQRGKGKPLSHFGPLAMPIL